MRHLLASFCFLTLIATGCAGMFGTLKPHPVVKVQNVGSAMICRVERQADGYDKEELLRSYANAVSGPERDAPIVASATREFEFPRPVKDAPPLAYTMRFWTCEGAPLTDKRVMAGESTTIAVP